MVLLWSVGTIEQYFPDVLFILYKVVVAVLRQWMNVTIQMKAIEEYFMLFYLLFHSRWF